MNQMSTCPLCYKRFLVSEIERHADICTGAEPPSSSSTSKSNYSSHQKSSDDLFKYQKVVADVLIYLNMCEKVDLKSLKDLQDFMKAKLNKCVVCELPLCKLPSYEKHVNECVDMMNNNQIKGQVEVLNGVTGRPRYEILLLARHYNLLDKGELNTVADLLQTGIDVTEWLKKEKKIIKECGICLDEFEIANMFTLDCPSSHRFCRSCMTEHLQNDMKAKRPSYCPGVPCNHRITELEVKQIFGPSRESEEYSEIILQNSLSQMPVVSCPTPGCTNKFEMVTPTKSERCECTVCGNCFCSLCQKEYHYRVSCAKAIELTARWIKWNQTERREYHSQQDEKNRQIFEEFEKEKKKIEERNKELKERYDELLSDEKWKEQHCSMCPNCSRPIEKLSGCDSMVCGQDAHGGNVQNGCGTTFTWTTAPKYKSAVASVQLEKANPKPPAINKIKHGEWRLCDGCRKEIVGLRFSCINCKSSNFCEKCEFKVGNEHFKGKHIFKIIDVATED